MDKQQAKELLERYLSGQCSVEEQALLEQWYIQEATQQELPEEEPDYEKMKQRIWKGISKPGYGLKSWMIAAATFFMLSAAIYLIESKKEVQEITTGSVTADIAPGKNAATLTLADGRRIILSNAANGRLAKVQGVIISKTADGQIIYKVTDAGPSASAQPGTASYNTLSTAKGETYQVRLPDGTLVWLNAGSSLKYPVSFTAGSERKVELSGEAYFEVFKDKQHPFVVKSVEQEVEVLGTHFNVSSYNKTDTRTTLIEGSVKVLTGVAGQIKTAVLKPGEQSVYSEDRFIVKHIDPELEIAWKNGKTEFEDADLKTIMEMLERWYNIEVIYQDRLTDSRFSGSVSRSKNISEVLKLLETTREVHFRIEGRRVIVMN